MAIMENGWNGIQEYPELHYDMQFRINGEQIPDPMSFSGAESDLDTMGERDANGLLHRCRVATKHPLKVAYDNIPWELIMRICSMLQDDKFEFTFPSPFSGKMETIQAYVGDREFESVWNPSGGIWLGSLKFSVIEY